MKAVTEKMKLGDLTKQVMGTSSLTPERQNNIQETLLPVLLCAYAKQGEVENTRHLCELQADVNLGDYDGKKLKV